MDTPFSLIPCGWGNQTLWEITASVALVYLIFVLLVRWHQIAKPSRMLLLSQIEGIRRRTHLETEGGASVMEAEQSLVRRVEELLGEAQALVTQTSWWDRLFWSRGQELGAWRLVHEAERLLVEAWPTERVWARMEAALTELQYASRLESIAWRQRLAGLISSRSRYSLEEARMLLQETLRVLYDERDTGFAVLLTWHSKSMFLIIIALGVILLVTAINPGFAILFLAGAAGGLLSRLARAVRSRDIPTDYGAFWVTFFLSVLVGALAGWAGVLLLFVLQQVGVLGELFGFIDLSYLCAPGTAGGLILLGLGLLFGFSERFFDQTSTAVEQAFSRFSQLQPAAPAGVDNLEGFPFPEKSDESKS